MGFIPSRIFFLINPDFEQICKITTKQVLLNVEKGYQSVIISHIDIIVDTHFSGEGR